MTYVRVERGVLLQALFTSQSFNFPLLVAFLQMSFICPVCYAVARPRISVELAKLVLPLALVNVLNVVCGLISASAHCIRPGLRGLHCSAGCTTRVRAEPRLNASFPPDYHHDHGDTPQQIRANVVLKLQFRHPQRAHAAP